MPKIGCELDKLSWNEVLKKFQDTINDSGVLIQITFRNELDCKTTVKPTSSATCIEDEIDNYTNVWTAEKNELETDFSKDSMSCQPP